MEGISFEKKDSEHPRFKNNQELYKLAEDLPFPTLVRDGVRPTHREGSLGIQEVYTVPTEPYEEKKKFLKEIGLSEKKRILSILGANWPIFYADLFEGEDFNITTVDENIEQLRFFGSFLSDPGSFRATFNKNHRKFISETPIPYYPDDVQQYKTYANSHLPRPTKREMDAAISLRRQNSERATLLRERLLKMVELNSLNAIIGDLRDVCQDLDLEGFDFVDLSNVPELIGQEETQKILDQFSSGTLVYMSFIVYKAKEFLEKIAGWSIVGQRSVGLNSSQTMVVLRKD